MDSMLRAIQGLQHSVDHMDDELGLDYMVKHFEPHTRPADLDGTQAPWRMLIVDGNSSHVACFDLKQKIIQYRN